MITSGLQYSCYHLVINHINRGGETIYVSLYNTVPLFSGLECAEDYRTIETTVDIPGSMEPCKVYRIVMNGDEFLNHFVQAIAPDVTCAKLEPVGYPLPDEPEYPTADVPAPIESVQITKTESLPPEYLVDITFALTSECDRFNGYHLQRAGSEINISVTNLVPRPEAQVVCPQNYDLRETSINLGSSFENGIVYSVNVNFEPVKTFIGGGGQAQSQPSVAIPLGKSTELETDGLTLEFLEVTEDSRCPTSSPLPCNWVGKAKVKIAASEGGEDLGEHELPLDPLRTASSGVRVGDYSLILVALNPYPATFDSASNAKYVATLYLARHLYSGEGSEIPKATVRAEAVPNEPGGVILFADIVGGSDNSKDLYCAGTEWQFGDGIGVAMSASCLPWTAESSIQRHFEQSYTYGAPGTYEVTFTHGPVKATTVVEVK
ncbi:MAG: hypothetical protein IIC23_06300 [Chloroflexi bacterium]|nr:hypothetical protein [Chloroflexota bacterium]